MSEYKRRVMFIKKGFQLRFIFHAVGFILMLGIFLLYDFHDTFGRGIVDRFMEPGLYQIYVKQGVFFLVKFGFFLLIAGFLAVIASHSVAGPLFHLEQAARIIGLGDLRYRIQLRKSDELQGLQDEFNIMISNLQNLVKKDAESAQKISLQLNEIKNTASLPPAVIQKLSDAQEKIDHLAKGFKI